MSRDRDTIAERLRFAAIDDETRRDLREAWSAVTDELPGIIRHFYRHIADFDGPRQLIADSGERLAKAQTSHWQRLFSGEFDEDYLRGARAIGAAHVRVGVDPGTYIGGYNFVIGRLIHVIGRRYRFDRARATRQVAAATKAAMLDLELAISVYHDLQMTGAEERRRALSEAISSFDRQMGSNLDELNGVAQTMRDAAGRLGESTTETTRQSVSVSSTAQDMARRIEDGAESGTRMSSAIAAIQDNAETSREVALKAVEQAEAADRSVRSLEEMTQRISSVVGMITEIAERTNLLALNATIEAARAGNAGRGFAVVASEVKDLSTQTGRATSEIAEQVRAIQSAMRVTVEDLAGIGVTIGTIAEAAGAIVAAVDEQSATTHAISQTLGQVAADAGGMANSIGSVHRAAEDATEVSGAVQSLAADLDQQARQMREDAKSFFKAIAAA